jgi:DNA-binding CsgD family transcriptional regulator
MVRVLFFLQLAVALVVLPLVPGLGPGVALWGAGFLVLVLVIPLAAVVSVHGVGPTLTALADAWSVRPRNARRSAKLWRLAAECFPAAGFAAGLAVVSALLSHVDLREPRDAAALGAFCLVWGLLGLLLSRTLAEVVRGLEASPSLVDLSSEMAARVGLTPRETEAARAVLDGLTYRAAGQRLGVSEATVKSHLLSVYQKTGAGNKIELLRWVEAESVRLHQKADGPSASFDRR